MTHFLKNKLVPLSYIVLILILMYSCKSSNDEGIYQAGRIWNFSVASLSPDSVITKSGNLNMEINSNFVSFISGTKGVIYTCDIDGNKKTKNTELQEIPKKKILISNPTTGELAFTNILPSPSVTYPLEAHTDKVITKNKIIKSTFAPAMNKEVETEYEKTGTEYLDLKNEKILCYKFEGKASSSSVDFGLYIFTYWFNEIYGFVKYKYIKPDGSSIIFELEDTNF